MKDWDARARASLSSAVGPEKKLKEVTSISLNNGHRILFLPLELTKKRALWFDELRKAVTQAFIACGGEGLLGQEGLSIRIDSLDRDQQKALWAALAFLSSTWSWKPTKFSKEKTPAAGEAIPLLLFSALREELLLEVEIRFAALGRANNRVRTWSMLPYNHLGPKQFREALRVLARDHALGFEFMGRTELTRLKAGGFLAVMAANPQCEGGIVKLSYRPRVGKGSARSPRGKPIALVGKGLCYDTGGYNLKPGASMLGMHGDMTGAAVVASYLAFLSEVKSPLAVDVYCAIAENLISESAYTPNQVVQTLDGTTIEVVDTDAEGRMALSDTLAWVRRQKPRLVIDYATLTGASIRALGKKRSAVFSNRPELARLAVDAGEKSGESTWSFPIGEEYRPDLESKVADLLQCADSHFSDHIYAATFLSHFVGDETPWVHVDLSAQECAGGLGLIRSDVSGFGILWTDQFFELFEAI